MHFKTLLVFLFLGGFFLTSFQPTEKLAWKKVDNGLYLTEFTASQKSSYGDSKITVLKINPQFYRFRLINAKEKGESNKTAPDWAKSKGVIAVINAGMYQQDNKTNVGYMKNYAFVNNGHLNNDNTVIAFNRKDTTVPPFQIIDRQCQNWDTLKVRYNSFSQGIRMINCRQQNRWSQQSRQWSIAAIGCDKQGNALFIVSRSPYSVHDFIDILLKAPLHIYNAMYLEGGPEVSFYLKDNGLTVKRFGSYESGFIEDDQNHQYWKIPNMIGIAKK